MQKEKRINWFQTSLKIALAGLALSVGYASLVMTVNAVVPNTGDKRVNADMMRNCTSTIRGSGLAGYQKLDYCRDLVKELTALPPIRYRVAASRHFGFWKCMEATAGEAGIGFNEQTQMCIRHVKEVEQ